MRIYTIIILAFTSLILSQCEVERYGCTDPNAPEYDVAADIDDGSCYTTDPGQFADCPQDVESNLAITNQTGETLYLYKNHTGEFEDEGLNTFITCIPIGAENFQVFIPNQSLSILRLQVWKASDVSDRYNPELINVYRQWSVALSNTTDTEERASWLITDDDQYGGTGTLVVTYPALDEFGHQVIYQVDIFLNSKNGAKLASLQPGVSDKKVSVDYGIHYLYFHYWYSDPNSTTGDIVEIGWDEIPEVVVNDQHREREIEIPAFISAVGKYGELKVRNEFDFAVNVYANDKLIEDIAQTDGPSTGLSAVPAGEESVFLIPVDQYTISLDNSKGDQVQEFQGIEVVQNETAVITTGVDLKSVRIINETAETLGLFTQGEEYLGYVADPGKTSQFFMIPADIDTLMLINFAKTLSAVVPVYTTITVSELEEYEYNYLELSTPWPLIGDLYQSPDISDNEETSMNGSIFISETAVLSFEYNVSSEAGYDFFIFLLDGYNEIDPVSGESDWVTFSKVIDTGTHTLQWIYSKDQTRSEGRDNVQIRNLRIE